MTNGLAPSCIAMYFALSSALLTPMSDDSSLVLPPTTTLLALLMPWSLHISASSWRLSYFVTTTISSMHSALCSALSVCAITGAPPSGMRILSLPMRCEFPAASTTAVQKSSFDFDLNSLFINDTSITSLQVRHTVFFPHRHNPYSLQSQARI